jgi:lipoprotein-releasing system permease protein
VGITFFEVETGDRPRRGPVATGSPDEDKQSDDPPPGPGDPPRDGKPEDDPPKDPPPFQDDPAPGSVRGTPNNVQLVISGVYDAEDTTVDATRLYMDLETLRRIARIEDPYHQLRVKLVDHHQAGRLKQAFARDMPEFVTETWQDQRSQFLKAVNNEKVLLVIVLSFIVLLGGFTILATLTLTVVEKTRDIGVLTALGASRRGVLSMFVFNGLMIGVLGAFLGLGLGALFSANVNTIKQFLETRMGIQIFPAEIYLFREIPTVWDWPTVIWIMGGSVLVAFFAGFFPALRAARMDPVRALRYE